MNAAITVAINKKIIKRYLTEPTYKSDLNNKAKFKVMDGTAVYDNLPIAQLDWEDRNVTLYDGVKGFAKQMQNIIKREAVTLGFNVLGV